MAKDSISRLELQYAELQKKVEQLEQHLPTKLPPENPGDQDMTQPSSLRIVDTMTSYGVIEVG